MECSSAEVAEPLLEVGGDDNPIDCSSSDSSTISITSRPCTCCEEYIVRCCVLSRDLDRLRLQLTGPDGARAKLQDSMSTASSSSSSMTVTSKGEESIRCDIGHVFAHGRYRLRSLMTGRCYSALSEPYKLFFDDCGHSGVSNFEHKHTFPRMSDQCLCLK